MSELDLYTVKLLIPTFPDIDPSLYGAIIHQLDDISIYVVFNWESVVFILGIRRLYTGNPSSLTGNPSSLIRYSPRNSGAPRTLKQDKIKNKNARERKVVDNY